MDILIWFGAAISLAGLAGIVASILSVARARRRGLSGDALRDAVRRVVPWNLGAFFLSMLGLIMVVTGVILA